jgi:hypothetical protein
LGDQANKSAACLQGLINSVEKERGKLARAAATVTSALVLCLARIALPRLTGA